MSEYVINSSEAWGRAEFQTDALENLVVNWHGDFGDEVQLEVFEVEGFDTMTYTGPVADEIISEEELVVDGRTLEGLQNALRDAEILAETAFEEADPVAEE